MADRQTSASSCLTAPSRSPETWSHGSLHSGTKSWLTVIKDLGDLHSSLKPAVESMEQDYLELLHLLNTENDARTKALAEKLQLPESYFATDTQHRLQSFEDGDIVNKLRSLGSGECPPFVKVAIRRWDARIRHLLEDMTLLQEDVGWLANRIRLGAGCLDSLLEAQELQQRVLLLHEHLQLPNEPRLPALEEKTIRVSRAFLSELVLRTDLLEKENQQLRSSQGKLKLVLSDAKEQRRQLKELAGRLKHERQEAVMELSRVSQQLEELAQERPEEPDVETLLTEGVAVSRQPDQKIPAALRSRRGKVQIFVRVRPDDSDFLEIVSKFKIVLRTRHLLSQSSNCAQWDSKPFYFDRVFDDRSSNANIFQDMHDFVNSCCFGVNVCIMAYGQTGSGKTYTMVGDQSQPGVNKLAISSLLKFCRGRAGWRYRFCLSAVEIYNEEIHDLLRPKPAKASPSSPKSLQSILKLVTNVTGDTVIQGLTEVQVENEQEVDCHIASAERMRIYSATNLNESSSRSHVIVVLNVHSWNPDGFAVHSTLTLCDLAGSESVSKSGVKGTSLREASAINRSLLSLGKVFEDLRKRQRPCFRESKLTRLLKPHLTGNSKCLVIVAVRQSGQFIDETIRSLIFGQNAMQTEPRSCTKT